MKLISVVIPTFDRQAATDGAIESVTPSDPSPFEIVVVDDCGTVPYKYERYTNSSGVPVTVVRTATNGGPGLARKLGVEKSRGCVIAFLDSDDVFEPGWADCILTEVLRTEEALRNSLFIGGNVSGGSVVQRRCVQLLASIPTQLVPLCLRIVTSAFNPFYTPATAMSKQICAFLRSGRYCEDYYTNAMAIFKAQRIVVLATTACTISRSPGSRGGLSELKTEMKEGESCVRRMMLHSQTVPLCYRAMVPLGMCYAALRPRLKSLLSKFALSYDLYTNEAENQSDVDTKCTSKSLRLAILGTRGIPARYGGFETFAEELATGLCARGFDVTVFCESGEKPAPAVLQGVRLRYKSAPALGPVQTILFDLKCLWAARKGYDVVYMLGYGAAPFCLIPRLWGSEVWINPDGLEWARAKWGRMAKLYFRLMEWSSLRVANRIIADSEAVAASLTSRHGRLRACTVIEYGCEIVETPPSAEPLAEWSLVKEGYYLVVCRLEPENHVLEILQAFQRSGSKKQLIVIGNHLSQAPYLERIRAVQDSRVRMIGTVYDQTKLISLRYHSFAYIHGHSVGGTNPSLLEAMGCGNLIFAHDNPFNRETLREHGVYFNGPEDLAQEIDRAERQSCDLSTLRACAQIRAREGYHWPNIIEKYVRLLEPIRSNNI